MPPKKLKSAAGYQLAKKLPVGVEINDLFKKKWIIGPVIGQGGFGVIYSASLHGDKSSEHNYVLKVEPRDNGPLFCEMSFYLRVAKDDYIQDWMSNRKLKYFGFPRLVSAGNYEYNGEPLRYLIIDRFGQDLHRIIQSCGLLPHSTAIKIAIRVLDVLEFIHDKGYAHADIKALNLLKGRNNDNEVYLVDYGLANRYLSDNVHRPEKIDPKYKHNGTVEFCARDSHKGLPPSRRGDLESLGYNLVFWLAGKLPWDHLVGGTVGLDIRTKPVDDKVKVSVANEKEKLMKNPKSGLLKSLNLQDIPGLSEYFNAVNHLGYTTDPDYVSLHKHLLTALKSVSKGQSKSAADKNVLEWPGGASAASTSQKEPRRKKAVSTKNSTNNNSTSDDNVSPKEKQSTGTRSRKPVAKKTLSRRSSSCSRDRSAISRKPKANLFNDHNGIIPGINSASNSFTNVAKFSTKLLPQKEIIPGLSTWKPASSSKKEPNGKTSSTPDSIEKKRTSRSAAAAKKTSTTKKITRNRVSAACQTSPIS